MAATTISVEQDQFCCSVCLEVLKDPVTIPCGHSYCLDCIEDYWNRPKQKGQYSCPQCRQVFNPKPLLCRNTVLAEVVGSLQRTTSRPPTPNQTKPGDIKCSVCTGRKGKAVKACLTCAGAYCTAHLKAHEERFHRGHKLIPATEEFKERLCPLHNDKVLKLFCRSEQQPVCALCVKDKHKGHEHVRLEEERAAQQRKLQESSLKSVQKMKEAEKELRFAIRYIKHSTEAVVEESERVFSRLVRSIEKQSAELEELLRSQERGAVGQAEEQLERVQRELSELRRGGDELERLSRTEDHVHFIQKSKSFHFPVKSAELPSTDALTYLMYKSMRAALADLKDSLDQALEREFSRISEKVISLKETNNQTIYEKAQASKVKELDLTKSEPKTRTDFLQYHHDLTLDPNTVNPFLVFSERGHGVTTLAEAQPYPDHPDRFTSWAQVLCKAGMAGRCYWEVEWSGNGGVSIGVCYKNISRSGGGSECKLGHNAKSWSLDCSYSTCSFQHNKESLTISAPCFSRIGVYLDYRAGVLAFYGVSDKMVLLHKAKAAFAQPLHPGFWVGLGSTLKLCSP
ncbi:tripartite motif-containing protein 16-like protein [Periophthalmus magnuspinnatus]|uniref:tripartite motif-containing protein 16-like protein n=1 Tax=Periophthalmus magnuspinnatus TaxID=409849 RepID=UPI00145BA790|nr:tripartite motif-containing protein 16-like protein [Periophthalmus magnuspinnatus]